MSRHVRPFLRFPFVLLACGLAGLSSTLSGQDAPLSLSEALRLADESNLTLKISRESVRQAQGQVGQQRSSLLPNVSFVGQQRRSESVSMTDRTPVAGDTVNRFDAKAVASATLVDPQQISNYKAAKKGVKVAELELQSVRQGELASVAEAYFTHLRNLRRLAVLDSNIERAEWLLTLSKNQASAGAATQIDVTRAEAQLALSQQERIQHSTTLVSSRLQLQRLLELPVDRELSILPVALRRGGVAGGDSSVDLHRWREARPDYQKAVAAVEQAKLELRSARAQRLPTLGVNGEFGKVSATLDAADHETAWFAYATISVPVFDGLKASADTRLALSRQRALELRLRQLSTSIDAELRLARQDSDSRDAQIKVAETSLRLAEEELSLARIRFQQGVADNREVVEAQNRLAEASDSLVEAEYMFNLARLELARARGDVLAILSEQQ